MMQVLRQFLDQVHLFQKQQNKFWEYCWKYIELIPVEIPHFVRDDISWGVRKEEGLAICRANRQPFLLFSLLKTYVILSGAKDLRVSKLSKFHLQFKRLNFIYSSRVKVLQ